MDINLKKYFNFNFNIKDNINSNITNNIINFIKIFIKKPIFKILIGFLSGFFCLYFTLIGFLLCIDLNQYKPQIYKSVHEMTGDHMEINGPLKLHCFPKISLEAHDITINKTLKMKNESIEAHRVKIIPQLLPLIMKTFSFNIELNDVNFKSFAIPHLTTFASIKSNVIFLKHLKVKLFSTVENTLNVLNIDEIKIDSTADNPTYFIKYKQRNFPLGLISDLLKSDFKITGNTKVNMKLTATGKTISQIKQSITGKVEVEIETGQLYGVDLISSMEEAKSLLNTMTSKVANTVSDALSSLTHHKKMQIGGMTPFTKLNIKAKLEHGFIYVQDMNVNHDHYDIKGAGKSHLLHNSLDYQIEAIYKKRINFKPRKNSNLPLTPLIIHISGTTDKPKIKPDFNSYIKYIHQS